MTKQPNVLLFLTDDQGWGDLRINGNERIDTPNLDGMAREGAMFRSILRESIMCASTRFDPYGALAVGEKQVEASITLAHDPEPIAVPNRTPDIGSPMAGLPEGLPWFLRNYRNVALLGGRAVLRGR